MLVVDDYPSPLKIGTFPDFEQSHDRAFEDSLKYYKCSAHEL